LDAALPQTLIAMLPSALPPLDLRDLDTPEPAVAPAPVAAASPRPTTEPEARGLLRRLTGARSAHGASATSFEPELRQRASELEQRGEYEIAAAFYAYLGESRRAAACYRRLAEADAGY
ncbi:MAG: hypothetical protein HGA45_38785, partial [Chloroflexales bacterium]|nr:hypothetical protein [Chloroflexales bacterium]